MRAIAGLVIACVVLASARPALGQLQMSAAKKEVWTGEERYCQFCMKGDIEAFMSLWDDTFVGWPAALDKPTDKAGIRKAISQVFAAGRSHCESAPLAVNLLGEFANTYYIFRSTVTDAAGKSTTEEHRITHTWRRSKGQWRIVGGMSGLPDKR